MQHLNLLLGLECGLGLYFACPVLCFLIKHFLHHFCQTDCLSLTANFAGRAGAFLSLLVEETFLCSAYALGTVMGNPALITGALSPLGCIEIT